MWPYLFAILTAVGIALNNTCVQLGMRYSQVTGAQALIINLVTGNILLLIIASIVFRSQGIPQLNFMGIAFFTAAGLMGPFFGRLLSFSAIKRIGAARTSVYRMSDMFFTMLLAFYLLNDPIKMTSLLGVLILAAGIFILINEKAKQADPLPKKAPSAPVADPPKNSSGQNCRQFFSSGVVLALTCSLFFALGGIFREMGINAIPSAVLGTLLSTFVALIVNLIYTYHTKQLGSNWKISRKSLLCFVLGGVGNSLGVLTFFLALVNEVPVSLIAALKNTSPVFTLFFSWIVFRKVEQFSLKLLISIFLVMIGATLIVW